MDFRLKSTFSLKSRFVPHFSDPNPIYLCNDGVLICGREDETRLKLCATHPSNLSEFEECHGIPDEITAYVASLSDNSSHSKIVVLMALNSNATRLATGSSDCTIRIWHIGNREGFVASCKSHTSKITLLRFHSTKPLLFSCSLGEVDLIIWNTETGEKVTTLRGHQGNVTDIAFSPQGEEFATCGHDKVIIVWSTKTMCRINTIPSFESLQSVVYLPPGSLKNHIASSENKMSNYLAAGGQWGIVRVWCSKTSRCVLELRGPTSHSSQSAGEKDLDFGLHSVSCLSLFHIPTSLDNPYVLVLSRRSSHVELYNATNFTIFHEFMGEIGSVDQLCLMGSAKNLLILADSSTNLKMFANPPGSTASPGSWTCHLIQSPHTAVIGDMAVSGCGLWLITGGHDQALCLWQLCESAKTADKPRLILRAYTKEAHNAHISAVCFARDSSAVFSASTDGLLKTWALNLQDVEKPPEEAAVLQEGASIRNAHDGAINCLHVSANGRFLATGSRDKKAKIWSLDSLLTGKDMKVQLVASLLGHNRGVWSVRFSDYERVLLTASGDKDLRLWNLKNMTCIQTLEGHEDPVYRAEFISKGRQILSCDQRGIVRLWNISKKNVNSAVSDDGKPPNVMEAHEGRVWAIAVRPDEGGFYTGGEDATICFFEDTTVESVKESTAAVEEFVKTQQEFENLLKNKRYGKALQLAVKLDKPQRAFEILQEISLNEGLKKSQSDDSDQLKPLEQALFNLVPKPPAPGEAPSEEMAQRLLKYAVHWNTRARTCVVAQRVFNWVVSNWAPERLLRWPGIGHVVTAFIPYTARHYQRLNRLEEQMTVVDYLFDMSRCNHISEWAKTPEAENHTTNEPHLVSNQPVVPMEVDDSVVNTAANEATA